MTKFERAGDEDDAVDDHLHMEHVTPVSLAGHRVGGAQTASKELCQNFPFAMYHSIFMLSKHAYVTNLSLAIVAP